MNQEVELSSIPKQNVSPEVNIIIDDSNDENACVICLENLNDEQSIRFHCGHIFHIHCILEWIYSLFVRNADISCPICRSIECHSGSQYYNIMKRAIGYNRPIQHNHNIEIQQRRINNSVDISSSQQRFYQNNQQVADEGLRKGFFRFMTCVSLIILAFFSFLIYTINTKR